MCGIAGLIGSERPDFADKALAALAHRGPDGRGVWRGANATLVHTRLAIIDLSDAGRQPMVDDRSGVCIAFNGEIYNFRELRRDLERDGVQFHTHTDTEVLLRLYLKKGERMVDSLRGMFAFAIHDPRHQVTLLARDPFGIKPLYYTTARPGELAFASEAKVLHQTGLADSRLNAGAIMRFLETGSVAEPDTLLADVRCLPAGHVLVWKNSAAQTRAYWSITFPSGDEDSRHDAKEITRAALLDSVEHHFISDVPVGLFLSGGVDSTALLALSTALGKRDLETFSIGVDDEGLDESGPAARTAQHFKSRHHELRLDARGMAERFPSFLKQMDQPSIDGFNTYCVAGFARDAGMKVVLSGLGGDEVFGGYPSFDRVPKLLAAARAAHHAPALARAAGRMMERWMPRLPLRRVGGLLQREPTLPNAYRTFRGIFTSRQARSLAAHFAGCNERDVCEPEDPTLHTGDARDQVSACELSLYMRNQLLKDSDVMSMAHGLELRVPLVDRTLFEAVSRIPAETRLRTAKQCLLDAVPEIPEWISTQPKRGFLFPYAKWLAGDWGSKINEARKHLRDPQPTWYQCWSVFMLERWLEARR